MNDAASRSGEPKLDTGKFTSGSIKRHVLVMSASGAVGLISIFAVDLLSLLYISWLGNVNFTAGVGYATAVMFFSTSANVGMMIGLSALVSRAIGAREMDRARRLSGTTSFISAVAAILVSALVLFTLHPLLTLMGATGDTHAIAYRFLLIAMPSNVFLGLGMALSGVLRAVGDARRSMFVTLSGGIASAIVDPILIFGFGLGTDGAAMATIISRLVFCIVGFYGAVKVHDIVRRPKALQVIEDFIPLFGIALPAVLTNLAGPVAGAYMTAVLAPYGDEAVAANAIVTRLIPVAFGSVFALSGAVGPIIGQNLGARNIARVRQTLVDSLIIATLAVVFAWGVLALARNEISFIFHANAATADLVSFFCLVIAGTWIFHGALFVANASFNNLGAPALATVFNWGKSTVGTIPFALVGAQMAGAKGALIGQGIGAILFGIGGVYAAFYVVSRIERRWNAEKA
jgi:putative MATE family efflux protein